MDVQDYYHRLLLTLRKLFAVLIFISILLSSPSFASSGDVLILYDSGGADESTGKAFAHRLRNLLAHYHVNITLKSVVEYAVGDVNSKLATFYIGSQYDEQNVYKKASQQYINYNHFLTDASTTTHTIVWINYNLWQLAWFWDPAWGAEGFTGKFGLAFAGIVRGDYTQLEYKKTKLPAKSADVSACFNNNESARHSFLELNQITIVEPMKADVHVAIHSSGNGAAVELPYITKAQNLWFIGDLPQGEHCVAMTKVMCEMLGRCNEPNA